MVNLDSSEMAEKLPQVRGESSRTSNMMQLVVKITRLDLGNVVVRKDSWAGIAQSMKL